MTSKVVNPLRGKFFITLGGQKIELWARAENLILLEDKLNLGLHPLAVRFSTRDIRTTDIAAIIYCFYEERDTDGYSFVEIYDTVLDEMDTVAPELIQGYIIHALRQEQLEELLEDVSEEELNETSTKKKSKR